MWLADHGGAGSMRGDGQRDRIRPTCRRLAPTTTRSRTRSGAVLTGAVDLARAAVVEFSGDDTVGDYLGVGYEDPTAATHRFLADLPGYQGWQWAVVVAAYPGADHATVSEVVLVPGPTALLAPEWVPWEQRVRPGDLSPGDLLAPAADDPRLVPGYTAQRRPPGRRDRRRDRARPPHGARAPGAAPRPRNAGTTATTVRDRAMARSTKRVCRDCGFLLPLAGSLGTMFGVCGNELSADGHVVDFNTAAARIPTPRPRRAAARRSTTRTTTACSMSSSSKSPSKMPPRNPTTGRSPPRSLWPKSRLPRSPSPTSRCPKKRHRVRQGRRIRSIALMPTLTRPWSMPNSVRNRALPPFRPLLHCLQSIC